MSEARGTVPSWVTRVPSYAGGLTCLLALLVLLGWARHTTLVLDGSAELRTMKLNTAISAVLGGASLLPRPRWTPWLALVPLVIGLCTAFEWIAGTSLGIDELVVRDSLTSYHPGRPSPEAAAALLVFAIARLLSASGRERIARVGAVFTAIFAGMAVVLLLGWIYRAPELTLANHGTGISAPGALSLAVLSVGLSCLHAHRAPLAYLWDRGVAGSLARRLLPTALVTPPVVALMPILGRRLGWYGANIGTAAFVALLMLLMFVAVSLTARSVRSVEEERLRATRELAAIFDSVPAMLTMRDAGGRLIRYNRPERIGPDGSADTAAASRPPEQSTDEMAAQETLAMATRRPVTRQYGPTENDRCYEVTKFPVLEGDEVLGIGGFILDITTHHRALTALRDAEQRARRLSEQDPLTGIWNRRWFESELSLVLASVDAAAGGALMIVDLDHFKTVNDTVGHDAGDRLLVAVATNLGQLLHDRGAVSRLGGDEFAVILNRGGREEVRELAERVVTAVTSAVRECQLDDLACAVTASVGVAEFADLPEDQRVARTARLRADEALYAAKRAGRGRYAIFSKAVRRSA